MFYVNSRSWFLNSHKMSGLKCIPLFVDGAYIIEFNQYPDHRGFFEELYNADKYPKEVGVTAIQQISCSKSKENVMRGLHCSSYYKLVTCVSGEVYDIIADIREDSPTYLKWVRIRLSADNKRQVYVPKGCAHSFYAVKDDSLMVYAQGGTWNPLPGMEKTVSWKDPVLNIQWPRDASVTVTSEKDANGPNLVIPKEKTVPPNRKRVLVIGASGKVGRAIADYIDQHCDDMMSLGTHCHNSYGANSMEFDLERAGTDETYARLIFDYCCPHVVVICGAISRSDQCENEKERANTVNVSGAANVAKYAVEFGAKVVAISTDYIFDGTKDTSLGGYQEDDKPNPLAEYGRSKVRMEEAVTSATQGKVLIVRTTSVNGPTYDNSGGFNMIHDKLAKNEEFTVPDVMRSPIYSRDLAKIIVKLVKKDASGVFNGAGDEEVRLPDYFRSVAKAMGLNSDLIKEKARTSYQPAYSVLSPAKRRGLLPEFKCRSVGDAIADWTKSKKK